MQKIDAIKKEVQASLANTSQFSQSLKLTTFPNNV